MKPHTKIYLKYFNYGIEDFIKCELPDCCRRAVDIHHIENRGSGGDPKGTKDHIHNLMALCREHHLQYGDVKDKIEWLQKIHYTNLRIRA